MDIKQIYDSILKEWLPTIPSRWIAGLTPSIGISAIFLPNFLRKIDILPTPEQTLLIRLSVPPTILFLGTFIVLLLVVYHFKSINKHDDQDVSLTETHEKVLNLLFNKESTMKNICNTFDLKKEEANYYLYNLRDMDMVNSPDSYFSSHENWSISQLGREYIIKKSA